MFLSLTSLEAVAGAAFDTPAQRALVSSLLYGVGLWGLIVTAMVWSQVGARVSQPNSDGMALTPTPEQHTKK